MTATIVSIEHRKGLLGGKVVRKPRGRSSKLDELSWLWQASVVSDEAQFLNTAPVEGVLHADLGAAHGGPKGVVDPLSDGGERDLGVLMLGEGIKDLDLLLDEGVELLDGFEDDVLALRHEGLMELRRLCLGPGRTEYTLDVLHTALQLPRNGGWGFPEEMEV